MQVSIGATQTIGDVQEIRTESSNEFVRARPLVVATTEGASGSLKDQSEDETRAGLRRLADLIRDKRRSVDPDSSHHRQPFEKKSEKQPTRNSQQKPTLALVPSSAPELEENRASIDSHHLISFIFHWQKRQRSLEKTVTDVILEEQKRRTAIARYQEAIAKGPTAAQPEVLLPALSY